MKKQENLELSNRRNEKIEKFLMSGLTILGLLFILLIFSSCSTLNRVTRDIQNTLNPPTEEQKKQAFIDEKKEKEEEIKSYKEIVVTVDEMTDTKFHISRQMAYLYEQSLQVMNEIRFNVVKVQSTNRVYHMMQLKHVSYDAKHFEQLAVRCGKKRPIAMNRSFNWRTNTDVKYYLSDYMYTETAEYEISKAHADYILSCKNKLKFRISGMSGFASYEVDPEKNKPLYMAMDSLYKKQVTRKFASK